AYGRRMESAYTPPPQSRPSRHAPDTRQSAPFFGRAAADTPSPLRKQPARPMIRHVAWFSCCHPRIEFWTVGRHRHGAYLAPPKIRHEALDLPVLELRKQRNGEAVFRRREGLRVALDDMQRNGAPGVREWFAHR